MPLELESLEDLKEYVEQFPEIPLFYRHDGNAFSILAGKVSWAGNIGKFPGDMDAIELENWLDDRAAKKIKGWRELESLFG